MNKQELAQAIKASIAKAAKSVQQVSVLGSFIHVRVTNQKDKEVVAELLSGMGCAVSFGANANDGSTISGQSGYMVYGRMA